MSSADRVRIVFKKYGRVGVGVHLAIYAATLSGCYMAAERNSKLEELLLKHGFLSRTFHHTDDSKGKLSWPLLKKTLCTGKDLTDDSSPEKRGWVAQLLTRSGSSLALAFLCTKALLPVRVPLTLAITPPLARLLQRRTANKAAKHIAAKSNPG